jgi:hypothetical protein
MQIETRTTSPSKPDVALRPLFKRRVRTDAGRLTKEATRRRTRANAIVVASTVVVLALVRIFYALLTG